MRSEQPISLPIDRPEPLGLRAWLRLPWECLGMLLGLLYWAVFGGFLTLVGAPLHAMLPGSSGQRLGRAALHHLFRCFVALLEVAGLVKADTRALDRLADEKQPFIIAPNHIALWDAVFIIARIPGVVCVMKKSILANPVLGGGARLAGYIPNDGLTRMIRGAVKSLEGGGRLLLFPEGTRTRHGTRWINPLKGGCAIVAQRARVPVRPVFIRSNTRFLEKGWPLWKRPAFPIHIRIEVGEPLVPGTGESPQDFTRRLESVFEQELSKPDPLRRQSQGQFEQSRC